MGQIQELLHKRPADFAVVSGDDALTLPMMVCGGQGVISVASNMFVKEMVEMTHAMLEGDMARALKVHNSCSLLCEPVHRDKSCPNKDYMAAKGLMDEVFRLPLCELKPQNKEKLLATFV